RNGCAATAGWRRSPKWTPCRASRSRCGLQTRGGAADDACNQGPWGPPCGPRAGCRSSPRRIGIDDRMTFPTRTFGRLRMLAAALAVLAAVSGTALAAPTAQQVQNAKNRLDNLDNQI